MGVLAAYLHGKHPFFDCFTLLRVRFGITIGNLEFPAVNIAAVLRVSQIIEGGAKQKRFEKS
jgi:hypothetical protein